MRRIGEKIDSLIQGDQRVFGTVVAAAVAITFVIAFAMRPGAASPSKASGDRTPSMAMQAAESPLPFSGTIRTMRAGEWRELSRKDRYACCQTMSAILVPTNSHEDRDEYALTIFAFLFLSEHELHDNEPIYSFVVDQRNLATKRALNAPKGQNQDASAHGPGTAD